MGGLLSGRRRTPPPARAPRLALLPSPSLPVPPFHALPFPSLSTRSRKSDLTSRLLASLRATGGRGRRQRVQQQREQQQQQQHQGCQLIFHANQLPAADPDCGGLLGRYIIRYCSEASSTFVSASRRTAISNHR